MAQKDTFPQLIATADPTSLDAVGEAKTGTPAMSLTREMYVVVTSGGGVIAAVEPIGDSLLNATLGLVTHACLKMSNGIGDFVAPVLALNDGEAGPLSGQPTALPVYATIAGVTPTVELRAAQMHHANGGDIATTILGDDLGGLLGCAGVPYLFNGVDTFVAERGAVVYRSVVATAAGETTVWDPAASTRFRLMGYTISVCGTLAATNVQTIDLLDGTGGTVIASHLAAVGDTILGDSQIGASLNNGYLSDTVDNNLVVDLGIAFTAGGCAINVWGTEEP
jgi:hypothetical protein